MLFFQAVVLTVLSEKRQKDPGGVEGPGYCPCQEVPEEAAVSPGEKQE